MQKLMKDFEVTFLYLKYFVVDPSICGESWTCFCLVKLQLCPATLDEEPKNGNEVLLH